MLMTKGLYAADVQDMKDCVQDMKSSINYMRPWIIGSWRTLSVQMNDWWILQILCYRVVQCMAWAHHFDLIIYLYILGVYSREYRSLEKWRKRKKKLYICLKIYSYKCKFVSFFSFSFSQFYVSIFMWPNDACVRLDRWVHYALLVFNDQLPLQLIRMDNWRRKTNCGGGLNY